MSKHDVYSLIVKTSPGIPSANVLFEIFEALVGPVLSFGPKVDNGPKLDASTGLAPMASEFERRPNLTGRGRKKLEFDFTFNGGYWMRPDQLKLTGNVSLHISQTAIGYEDLTKILCDVMRITKAPLGYIDNPERKYAERRNAHRVIFQDGKVGLSRTFEISHGLSGIPFRTVFGPDLVAHFGKETLQALPATLSAQIDEDIFLLSPCLAPENWIATEFGPGESQLIAAMGERSFFDPVAETLATDNIHLASHPPHAVKLQSRDGWQYLNGYNPDTVERQKDALDYQKALKLTQERAWNANREAFQKHLENDLVHGFVPEMMTLLFANDDQPVTAFVVDPGVLYAVPEVDFIVAGKKQKAIPWSDIMPALQSFQRLPAGSTVTTGDKQLTLGTTCYLDRKGDQSEALQRVFKTHGKVRKARRI